MGYPFSGILVRYKTRAIDENSSTGLSSATEASGEPAEQGESIDDQLHVNLWEVRERFSPKKESALDLGIMIADWESIGAVVVDLPWNVKREDVSDLGSRLNSEKTIAAIFNEIVRYDGCADDNFARISFRSGDPSSSVGGSEATADFALLRLPGRSYHVEKVPLGHGTFSTQLHIELPMLSELKAMSVPKIYLRFRIDCVPRDVYSYIFEQADRNILSSTLETRIIDFRINVRRGIPDEIFATAKNFQFPKFRKIHFFLTINRAQICDFESKNFVGCRSLVDEAVWNEYLHGPNSGASPHGMKQFLGYQWTESEKKQSTNNDRRGVKDLVVLGRFSSYNSTVFSAIRFLVVGLFFGAIGNGLWEVFKPEENYLTHLAAQKNTIKALALLLLSGITLLFGYRLWCIFFNGLRRLLQR